MKYKFMQIYGNCTTVQCLGKNREFKGPVDNVITKGIKFLKILLEGDYLKYLQEHKPIITARKPSMPGDHEYDYKYDIVEISHNDPRTEKSIIELTKRLNTFKQFKTKVLNDSEYYFIYSINQYDLNKETHKMNLNIFIENIEYLKKQGLLNKIIFVETKHENTKLF